MPGTRLFVDGDIPQVADLIWKVMHGHAGPAPSTLQAHLQELFLRNPWLDDGIPSLVFEDSRGRIVGFFGAIPRQMLLRGRRIRLAFGSNFVVDPESRSSLAAVSLISAFLKGTQDISITDSANETGRRILQSFGFEVVPIYSLQWARPLRPSLYAVKTLSRFRKSRFVNSIGSIARPLCSLADVLAASIPLSPFRQSRNSFSVEELDTDTLLQCLSTLAGNDRLIPEYDRNSLNWVFNLIANRNALGNLRRALVRDKDRKIVGWYIYAGSAGEVGEVLQIGSDSVSMGLVLDHLFNDAWNRGFIGLHGRLEPQFMEELTLKSCFFYCRGNWTLVKSNRPELLALFQSGNAFFSRLDGEWPLRHGGELP